jgi:hypothetical protein
MHTIAIMLIAMAATPMVAESREPHIALLLSPDGRHHDEFDLAIKTLGWSADRYPSTPDTMKSLVSRLHDYDVLLVGPLFGAPPPAEDSKAYRKFLEDGGMIAVTDGSYEGVRAWLTGINPTLGGLEAGKCNSSQWAVNGVTTDADPPHPLRFFPSQIAEPNSWPHFLKPSKDSRWQVVANCSEGFPVTLAQTVGKGLVSLSALRQPSAKQLANFYSCLLLSRAGLTLKSCLIPAAAVGKSAIRMQFSNNDVKNALRLAYEVVSSDGNRQRFEKDISGTTFELPIHITQRGPITLRLLLDNAGQETLLFSRKAMVPALLTVKPNAYRGILSTERRLPAVNFGVELVPDEEELEGATVELTVMDPKGNAVAKAKSTIGKNGQALVYRQPVNLDNSLPAGNYSVRAVLVSRTASLAETAASFNILAPQPAQTIIDEDNTLLVDGKPYFPLGLYHVPPDDYAKVASLGINTVQFWVWHAPGGLDQAAAHGLKTIFEQNHKSEDIVRDAVRTFGENPTILMWYGLDEPAEGSYGLAEIMRSAYHQSDIQHPVYTVSCRPDLYAEQADFADVFAIDPYGKPAEVLECILKATATVNHRKPLICVPGVFGKETPESLREIAYLAIAHDARGLVWYPWCQTGGGPVGVGLKNSPEQQAVIKQLCSEIHAIEPALTSPIRHPFVSTDGKLHGICCVKPPQRYLLMVNTTPEKLESDVVIPASENVTQKFRDFFGKRDDVLSVTSGKFRIALEPYETRVYWSE